MRGFETGMPTDTDKVEQCKSLIPGVNDAAAITIFIAIGFVVGSLLTSCIFCIRHRKARQVDHEFRERFGSPLAGVVVGSNTNTTSSQQQQNVSLLLNAAAAPAYPEPMNPLYIPQKPPLLPKTMDMLSKAGPLGYSITSLRDSLTFSEVGNNPKCQNLQQNDQGATGQQANAVLIPAYFGNVQQSSSSNGSAALTASNISSTSATGGKLDASASVIIREEGPPNASNVFRSPFTQRKTSRATEQDKEEKDGEKIEQHTVAPPPIFISPPKGLATIGPLARSLSNFHIPSEIKSCPTAINATKTATATAGAEEKEAEDDGTTAAAEAKADVDYENPFATTSAAKAAHKNALLELEAAEKQGLVLKSTSESAKITEKESLHTQIGSNDSKRSTAQYDKPAAPKVTPKRGMSGIGEIAQVLDKKLEKATSSVVISDIPLTKSFNVGQVGGGEVPQNGNKEEKTDTVLGVDGVGELNTVLRKSLVFSTESRAATPSKEKAE